MQLRKAVVVGAGISGLTAAIALQRYGWSVTVLETRDAPGGNCAATKIDGATVHAYGPHIWHTNNEQARSFISDFTHIDESYIHRVYAVTDACRRPVPVPYNLESERMIGRRLTDAEIVKYFFEGYSSKMWGCPFEDLPESVRSRVPKRRSAEYRYFTDTHQGLPDKGYEEMFYSMVNHIGAHNVKFGEHPNSWREEAPFASAVVYTGKLDEYHNYVCGELPYRALTFEFDKRRTIDTTAAVVNVCVPRVSYTRYTDYNMLCGGTTDAGDIVIGRETPTTYNLITTPAAVPSYPMPWVAPDTTAEYMGRPLPEHHFMLGRMATYSYINMDQAVVRALELAELIDKKIRWC